MKEKFGQQPSPELQTTDKDSKWFGKSIAKILTEQAINKEEAVVILWAKTLKELREVAADSDMEEIPGNRLSKKIDIATRLLTVATEILSKDELDQLKNSGDGNKFRPLNIPKVTDGEILDERNKFIDRSKTKDLGRLEAGEIVSCKKIAAALIDRLCLDDGIQKLAALKTLTNTEPEMAADLGKLFHAVDFVKMHGKRLETIEKKREAREKKYDELTGRIRQDAIKPIVYIKEILDKLDLGEGRSGLTYFPRGAEDVEINSDMRYYFPTTEALEVWDTQKETKN